jgi:hypothetical protein
LLSRRRRSALRRYGLRRRSGANDANVEKIGGHACLSAHRPTTDSSRAHSALKRSDRLRRRSVCRCGCFELVIDGRRLDGDRDFVIAAASAKINEIRVVRIMKNAQEIPFA